MDAPAPRQPLPRWLAIAGPTASGKTALALALAQRWPVELVSVDSALVYRGMDVGSAKPSAAERAAVPHHLIDIRDPTQPYSAADFARDARACLQDIAARGRLPVLVGGTMLYFLALLDGLDDMPAAQPERRAAIEAEARARGWPALHADLARVDPATAARLAPHDAQRIGRALEVFQTTGQPLSALHRKGPRGQGWGDGLMLSLEPTDRAWLHARIAERFGAMLAMGLVDEVRALRARGDLRADLPSMRCVGYRQTWQALDAAAALGRDDLTTPERAALRERGIEATRQLAKRQLTWLRSLPQRQVVACDQAQATAQALAATQAFIEQGRQAPAHGH